MVGDVGDAWANVDARLSRTHSGVKFLNVIVLRTSSHFPVCGFGGACATPPGNGKNEAAS